jgi:hypothetical protein
MRNLRRQDRVDCDIILNKYEEGAMNIVRATNISLGGMRFRRLLEPYEFDGERIRLEIELPGREDPLLIGAKKVYQDDDYVGVRFTDISHKHFMRLRDWLVNRTIDTALPVFP